MALIALALLLDFLTGEVIPQQGMLAARPGPVLAVLTGVLSLAFPTVGALIASRLPTNPIGWIFSGMGLLYAAGRFSSAYADYALMENFAFPGGEYVAWFSTCLWFATLTLGVFLILLFPDGRLPSRWWRIVAWAAFLGAALAVLGTALIPDYLIVTHPYVENPFGVVGVIGGGYTTYELFGASRFLGMALLLTSSLASLFSPILRLRHTTGNERQQIKLFLFAAVPLTVVLGLIELDLLIDTFNYDFGLKFDFLFVNGNSIFPSWQALSAVLFVAVFSLLFVPVFTYIAILRHRLYDIDVIINRTLVYGALTSCVVGIYVLAVGGLGALFESRGDLGVSLLATGLVAVLFQPLRNRFQRGVNRLMYGERDDPYAVISRLGRRLEATLAPDTVLPTVVETIAEALKLPYAAILLKEGASFRTASSYGSPTAEPEALPLVYQKEEIGRLLIGPRAPGEGFSDADRGLLEDLARQAEVAVHAVRLTADLQRSRERLVKTREEERRRLRRDLHDGFGPKLASLGLGLNVVRKLMASNELRDADGVLSRLERETEETVADVRRLIYGLRPPTLDDLGLVAAIRQQAESQGMVVTPVVAKTVERRENQPVFWLEAPEDLPPLPAAVEVAAYRIAQEAITNVARHARARTCRVRLSVDEAAGALLLEITDDGIGISTGRRAGVGLSSMRERAVELGGTCEVEPISPAGTRVLARLLLPTSEEPPQGVLTSWSAPSESS